MAVPSTGKGKGDSWRSHQQAKARGTRGGPINRQRQGGLVAVPSTGKGKGDSWRSHQQAKARGTRGGPINRQRQGGLVAVPSTGKGKGDSWRSHQQAKARGTRGGPINRQRQGGLVAVPSTGKRTLLYGKAFPQTDLGRTSNLSSTFISIYADKVPVSLVSNGHVSVISATRNIHVLSVNHWRSNRVRDPAPPPTYIVS